MSTRLDDRPSEHVDRRAPRAAPSLVDTASVPLFGTLAWTVWVWGGLAVVVTAIGVALAASDPPDTSMWGSAVSALSWVAFATGVTLVSTFSAMLVANGATRRRFAAAGALALAAVVVLDAVVAFAGFAIEGAAFDAAGWSHVLDGDGDIDSVAAMAGLSVGLVASFACYAVAGWIVGAAWERGRDIWFLAALVPAVGVLVAGELLVDRAGIGLEKGGFDLPLAVGAAVALLVAGLGALLAAHITRGLRVQP
jgi:hypothetical protein